MFRKSHQSYDFHLLKIGVNGMTIKSSFDIKKNVLAYLNEYQAEQKAKKNKSLMNSDNLKT